MVKRRETEDKGGRNMKKMRYILAGIVAAAVLSGCGADREPQQVVQQTQPIMTESLGPETIQETAPEKEEAASETGETQSGASDTTQESTAQEAVVGETDEESYYRVKAEKEAVEIELDRLEASFRVGELDEESFRSQKWELELQEEELEDQEDYLEHAVDLAYYQSEPGLPEGDLQSLLQQMQELKKQELELEAATDSLERSYRNEEISREDFIRQMTEAVRSEEALDRQEELLERALERLGYDD